MTSIKRLLTAPWDKLRLRPRVVEDDANSLRASAEKAHPPPTSAPRTQVHSDFTAWHTLFFVLVLAVGVNAFRNSFQFFMLPAADTFGVGRSEISSAAAVFMFCVGLSYLTSGWVLRRIRIIVLMRAGVVALVLACILTALAPSALAFVFAYGVAGGFAFACIVGVPSQMYVSGWFARRRALALSFLANANFAGILLFSPVFVAASAKLGVGVFYAMLGAILAALLLPIALFGLRTPQGETSAATAAVSGRHRASVGVPLERGTLTFIGALFVCGFTMGFIDAHLVPAIADAGLPGSTVAAVMSAFGVVAIVGGLLAGVISDRLGSRYGVLSCLFLLRATSFLLLLLPLGPWRFPAFVVMFGISYTGVIPVSAAGISERVEPGMRSWVLGIALLMHQLGGMISVYLGGVVRDTTSNYAAYWVASGILALTVSLLTASIRGATTTELLERGCAICVIFLCTWRAKVKGGAQVKRLLETLNNPKVALVVGVVAVAVNGSLYFFYYLPRMTPLIEQIQSINKPFAEVVSKPEVISEALPKVISKALPEAPSGSPPSGSPPSGSPPSGSPPEPPTPPQRQTPPPAPQQQSSSTASPTASPTPPPQQHSSPTVSPLPAAQQQYLEPIPKLSSGR
jgi:MFS family permease